MPGEEQVDPRLVEIGDAASELARLAAPVARAEGFELHARSMEARIRDNGRT